MNDEAAPSTMRYVVMRFHMWERIHAITPAELPVEPIGKSTGFLLVYDTMDDLRKDYPDANFITIASVEPPTKPVGRHQRRKRLTTKGKKS